MTLDGIEKRIEIFRNFDLSIEKLKKDNALFNEKIIAPISNNQEALQIYGLAFNYALSLHGCLEQAKLYGEEIKNSLLDDRFDINKKNADEIEQTERLINHFINRIVESDCTFDCCLNFDSDIDANGEDSEKLLSDNNYLIELSNDLAHNGNKILHVVSFYLRHLKRILIDIKNNRVNMTENDYRFLFEREMKDYLSTEEWSDLQDSFIERTIRNKYHGEEPTIEQLSDLLSVEIDKIEGMSDTFGSIEAYLDDYTKLAKIIIRRKFVNETRTPVLDFFYHLGRKGIIEKWIVQREDEKLCYVPLEDGEVEFAYGNKYSKSISKKTFPKIQKLFEGRNTKDWVCFYHVLVCYHYIICDDFNAFNRWLTELAGREIISAGYARVIKMEYWAQNINREWSKDEAIKYKNSKQQEQKYRDYIGLCDQIREIINKG